MRRYGWGFALVLTTGLGCDDAIGNNDLYLDVANADGADSDGSDGTDGSDGVDGADSAGTTGPTWHGAVRAIALEHCVSCHVEGGVGALVAP